MPLSIERRHPPSSGSEVRYLGELVVGVNRKSSPGELSSQKKRNAVVRKEPAEAQDCESCQQNHMEVDRNEDRQQDDMEADSNKSMEEFGFVSSAVSDSAKWCEPLRVENICDQKGKEKGFKFYDVAAILVEDNGKPHTINFCRNCYNLRLTERDESKVTNARWKSMIEQKASRGRLSAAFRSNGFVKRMCKRYAVNNL